VNAPKVVPDAVAIGSNPQLRGVDADSVGVGEDAIKEQHGPGVARTRDDLRSERVWVSLGVADKCRAAQRI
jgi:hypothetical protein